MPVENNAIISIHPIYADAILSGSKTIELRRRIPAIEIGTRLWIYATRPKGAVVGSAIVERIVRGSPNTIWTKCRKQAGVNRADYDAYFEGAGEAVGLYLDNIEEGEPINIEQLRSIRSGFHPPQVIAKLTTNEAASLRRLSKIM